MPSEDLRTWCGQQGVPLHVFEWRSEHQDAGLTRDATYLLRPDTYVAAVEPLGGAEALERYRTAHGLTFGVSA
jgi:hypothetical protein